MSRVLLTAYEPYDDWPSNVSQMVLDRLMLESIPNCQMTPRVYPVDFDAIEGLIAADIASGYDYAIHMGQAPSYTAITLEAIGVNVALQRGQAPEEGVPLVAGGETAYSSNLPLQSWAKELRVMGIPATVSYHAGTFLCNAALYLSRYEVQRLDLSTKSVFLHLPLAPEQSLDRQPCLPSLSLDTTVHAVRWILHQLT